MKLLILTFCLVVAGQAFAQAPQLNARDMERLQKEKEKKCQRTLNTIDRMMRQQTLKDVIRDNYFLNRANGYIAVYDQMGCEAADLLKVLDRAPMLSR